MEIILKGLHNEDISSSKKNTQGTLKFIAFFFPRGGEGIV